MNLTYLIRREIKLVIVSIFCFLLAAFGLSYGFLTSDNNRMSTDLSVGSASFPIILTDNTTITETDIEPGDTFTKTITVENRGNRSIKYNLIWGELLNNIELELSATCSSNTSTCSGITTQTIPLHSTEVNDELIKKNISIAAGEIHTYVVTVKFKEEQDLQEDYTTVKNFYGKINIEEYEPPFNRIGTDTTKGLPVVQLKGTNEEFYDITNTINYSTLISTNGNIYNYAEDKSILLAKYNLYVGRTCTSLSSCTPISTSATGYGLQSVDAKGFLGNWNNPAVGGVPFSGSSTYNGYWYDSANSTIYSKYGTSYNASNIYDTNYVTAPGNANYSIAYYVEEYVNRLGIEGTGRLLTYTEANAMTQAQITNGADYWLGSAGDDIIVGYVYSDGSVDFNYFALDNLIGVRPVIVVNTSDIAS